MSIRLVVFCMLGWLFAAAPAYAVSPPGAGQNAGGLNANPTNSPIRRINPNSRQGTVLSAPALRDGAPGPMPARPPTLENGGIGNGQRFPVPAPAPGRLDQRR